MNEFHEKCCLHIYDFSRWNISAFAFKRWGYFQNIDNKIVYTVSCGMRGNWQRHQTTQTDTNDVVGNVRLMWHHWHFQWWIWICDEIKESKIFKKYEIFKKKYWIKNDIWLNLLFLCSNKKKWFNFFLSFK